VKYFDLTGTRAFVGTRKYRLVGMKTRGPCLDFNIARCGHPGIFFWTAFLREYGGSEF
jgi:hypothetical protein